MSARLNRAGTVEQGKNLPSMGPAQPLGGPISIPTIEAELIAYLKQAFPVTVSRSHDLRDYDRMAGQQELIEHLTALYRQQQDER